MLQPKFLTPLGTRSLTTLDPSIFLPTQDSLDWQSPFEAPFFDPPEPRRSSETVTPAIQMQQQVQPKFSTTIPEVLAPNFESEDLLVDESATTNFESEDLPTIATFPVANAIDSPALIEPSTEILPSIKSTESALVNLPEVIQTAPESAIVSRQSEPTTILSDPVLTLSTELPAESAIAVPSPNLLTIQPSANQQPPSVKLKQENTILPKRTVEPEATIAEIQFTTNSEFLPFEFESASDEIAIASVLSTTPDSKPNLVESIQTKPESTSAPSNLQPALTESLLTSDDNFQAEVEEQSAIVTPEIQPDLTDTIVLLKPIESKPIFNSTPEILSAETIKPAIVSLQPIESEPVLGSTPEILSAETIKPAIAPVSKTEPDTVQATSFSENEVTNFSVQALPELTEFSLENISANLPISQPITAVSEPQVSRLVADEFPEPESMITESVARSIPELLAAESVFTESEANQNQELAGAIASEKVIDSPMAQTSTDVTEIVQTKASTLTNYLSETQIESTTESDISDDLINSDVTGTPLENKIQSKVSEDNSDFLQAEAQLKVSVETSPSEQLEFIQAPIQTQNRQTESLPVSEVEKPARSPQPEIQTQLDQPASVQLQTLEPKVDNFASTSDRLATTSETSLPDLAPSIQSFESPETQSEVDQPELETSLVQVKASEEITETEPANLVLSTEASLDEAIAQSTPLLPKITSQPQLMPDVSLVSRMTEGLVRSPSTDPIQPVSAELNLPGLNSLEVSQMNQFPELPTAIQRLSVWQPLVQMQPIQTQSIAPMLQPSTNQIAQPDIQPQSTLPNLMRQSNDAIANAAAPAEWSTIAELFQATVESPPESTSESTNAYADLNSFSTAATPTNSISESTDTYADLNLFSTAAAPTNSIQRELTDDPLPTTSTATPTFPSEQTSLPTAPPIASPEQIERLAQAVYQLVRQRLALERERVGQIYSGRSL
jgi:hypothetical protein